MGNHTLGFILEAALFLALMVGAFIAFMFWVFDR